MRVLHIRIRICVLRIPLKQSGKLSVDTWALLAKRLAHRHSFTELYLADYFIGGEGQCVCVDEIKCSM